MNSKSLFIIKSIIFVLLCAGCKKPDANDLICFDIDNTRSKTVAFDDLFEIEKIVVLEETVESLVSHIIKVEYLNNNFFVSDNRHSIVLRFNENGKYLNSSLQDFTDDGILCWVYSPAEQNETFDEILKDVKTNNNGVLILTKLKKTKI